MYRNVFKGVEYLMLVREKQSGVRNSAESNRKASFFSSTEGGVNYKKCHFHSNQVT